MKIVEIVVTALVVIAVMAIMFSLPVMWLWNYLMPDLFSLQTINFWQALCINLLCGFLFRSSNSSSSNND